MSIDGISTPASYVYSSESGEFLPPELRYIVYGFLDTKSLTKLYSRVSSDENGLIGTQATLQYRIQVVQASAIKNSLERAKRLKEIGKCQLQIHSSEAQTTADLITVMYLKIQLLCEIGKAIAHDGNSDDAKKLFGYAKIQAEAFNSPAEKVYSLVRIGKAEIVSNDSFGSNSTFTKASAAADCEINPYIKAQFQRLIDRERKLTPT
jgi:hypothetical protein